MNIQTIKGIPIISVMAHYGVPISKHSGDALFYFAPWRKEHTASVKVSIRNNLFIDFGDEKRCGSAIDLVMNIENCGFMDAVRKLETMVGIERTAQTQNAMTINKSNEVDLYVHPGFIVQKESDLTDKELMDYVVHERKIPVAIAQKYLRELEIEHSIFHKRQTVMGMKNHSNGWEVRGTNGNFKSCIGHKDFTFFDEGANKILVVEGMFDLLSGVVLGEKLCPEKCNYMVLHSLNNLNRATPKMLEHDGIFLALDLDTPGRTKTKHLLESDNKFIDLSPKYQMNGGKDLNDFLKYYQQSYQSQNHSRGRHL